MNQSVNLNEFSIDQLRFVLRLVELEINRINYNISVLLEDGDPDNDIGRMSGQLDIAITWKVQIMTTIEELKIQLS